jgi:hypothetical protein
VGERRRLPKPVGGRAEDAQLRMETGSGKCVCMSIFKAAKNCPVHGWKDEVKDRVTLLPVPDGTRELSYTAKDEGSTVEVCRAAVLRTSRAFEAEPTNENLSRLDNAKKCLQAALRVAAKESLKADPLRTIKRQTRDSLTTPLSAFAALLAILAWFHSRPAETVGPESYDLTTYRPERKTW